MTWVTQLVAKREPRCPGKSKEPESLLWEHLVPPHLCQPGVPSPFWTFFR